jgi:AhpD family alkylhydroperoxidase
MTTFPIHTAGTAPAAARESLAYLTGTLGAVPNLAATMASSPPLVNTLVAALRQFGAGTFTAAERQTLLLTNAVTNRCAWAVAFHSTQALAAGVDPADVAAIRSGQPPADPRAAALSALTRSLIERRGRLSPADWAGFTAAEVLEVLTGVGLSSMTNLAGNLAEPPLDESIRAQAWDGGY